MIQGDLVHVATARRQTEHTPHDLLINPELARYIAHARRPEPVEIAEQRLRARPDPLLFRCHPHLMLRAAQPGAIDHHHARGNEALHRRREQRRRQAWVERQPHPLLPHALQVRSLGMEGIECCDGGIGKALPGRASHGNRVMTALQDDQVVLHNRLAGRCRGGRSVAEKSVEIDKAAWPIQHARQRRHGVRGIEREQLSPTLRRPSPALRRAEIEQHAAADGAARGRVADDEPVAGRRRDRLVEHDLDQLGLARRDRRIAQHDETGGNVRRAVMQPDRHPLADRLGFGFQHPQPCIDAAGRRVQRRVEHDVAADDRFLGHSRSGQRQRTTLTGLTLLRRPVLHVQRTNPRLEAGRTDDHRIADRDPAGENRAGDNCPSASQRKRTINREAKPSVGRARGCLPAKIVKTLRECRDALASQSRYRQDLRVCQSGVRQGGTNLRGDRAPAVFIGEIRFGQGDNAARQSKQIQDGKVLTGLRHDAVIGGHNQQHEIDAGRAGQHVVHELFMARHVDEADDPAIRPRPIGKAEIEGDAARLFLRQAVGVDTGQCPHQCRLAMVDMPCGPDDHAALRSASRR
ncbi:MAG: hypothetical protein R3D05_11515 [Dongiaceae bacterium]